MYNLKQGLKLERKACRTCAYLILTLDSVLSEDSLALAAGVGSPKQFQKRKVSSAAAEQTVVPSGLCRAEEL